ncbi:MAG: hypothetical protein ACLR1T_12765 [Evtepia gabavorous]
MILTRFCETVMPDGPVSHQEMVRNLQNSSLRKKDTLAAMAQVLLDDGFAPAFVAGLLGNIIEEGDCGRFESSAYLSNPDAEPDYLVYMDENYDYRDKYSYRLIYEGISLQEVYAMVLELGPAGANGREAASAWAACSGPPTTGSSACWKTIWKRRTGRTPSPGPGPGGGGDHHQL